MDKQIVALFGVNKFNFVGWVLTFLLLFVLATVLVVGALVPPLGLGMPAEVALLTAACVLLAGIFGVLVQLYCALMAVRIELAGGRGKGDSDGRTSPGGPDAEPGAAADRRGMTAFPDV